MQDDGFMARLRVVAGELLVPALLLGYATYYYLEVRALPRPETNLLLIEPVYFILLACCLLFGAGRILAAFRTRQQPEDSGDEPVGGRLDIRKSVAFVVLTLAYVVLIPVVGFAVTTILYIVLLSLVLGVRSLAALTITPFAVVGLLHLGMERWLNLPLPGGLLL